jgi:hypothetical protein
MSTGELILLGAVLSGALLYVCPGIIAHTRHHPQAGAISLLVLLLGWTVIGWIVALVWSATSPAATQTIVVNVTGAPGAAAVVAEAPPCSAAATAQREVIFCAQCGKKREGTLNFCRHCGATLA